MLLPSAHVPLIRLLAFCEKAKERDFLEGGVSVDVFRGVCAREC